MSRAYHVVWLKASQTVSTEDRLSIGIDLLDVLPEAEMIALLKEQLKSDGWKDKNGKLSIKVEGLEVSLGDDGKTIEAALSAEETVTARGTNKSQAKAAATSQAEARKKEMAKNIAKRLMQLEPEVRERVQKSLQKVYLDALEKKARAMGDVESIVHSEGEDGEVEVVITVKA